MSKVKGCATVNREMGVGMDNGQKNRSGHSGRKLFVSMLLVLLLIAIGVSSVLFFKYKQAMQAANDGGEREQIIRRLEQVIALPNEQPDLSTVLDTAKLTNETLKQRAKNGDKLLVYNKAKRLIIYRPATGKVVDMLTIRPQSDTVGATNTN